MQFKEQILHLSVLFHTNFFNAVSVMLCSPSRGLTMLLRYLVEVV